MPYAVNYSVLEENRFEFTSTSLRVSEGDEVLFFTSLSKTGVQFIGLASVVELKVHEQKSKNKTVFVDGLEKFEQPRQLSALAGSLAKVKDYLNSDSHFEKTMVQISKPDFETIVNFNLDVPRSVFQFLFSALPVAVKADFLRIYVDQFSSDGIIASYNKPASLLLDFLETRLADLLEMLKQIHDSHRKLQDSGKTGIPDLAALVLCEASDRERHFLGNQCIAAADFLNARHRFGVATSQSNLELNDQLSSMLAECRKQLSSNPRGYRLWKDRIF